MSHPRPWILFQTYRRNSPVCRKALTTFLIALVLLATASACGETRSERNGKTSERQTSSAPPAVGVAETTEQTESGLDGFVASGRSSGGEPGAADLIEDVRLRIFDGYEHVVIDFGRDGESAGIPRWSVESPQKEGYVRVRFPGVAATAVPDKNLVGSLANKVHMVRDGGLFADIFANRKVQYRVTESNRDGQLYIDFRSTRGSVDLPPTTGERVVVLQPREAKEVGAPLTVRGYTRVSKDKLEVSLLDREVISSKTVRVGGRTST